MKGRLVPNVETHVARVGTDRSCYRFLLILYTATTAWGLWWSGSWLWQLGLFPFRAAWELGVGYGYLTTPFAMLTPLFAAGLPTLSWLVCSRCSTDRHAPEDQRQGSTQPTANDWLRVAVASASLAIAFGAVVGIVFAHGALADNLHGAVCTPSDLADGNAVSSAQPCRLHWREIVFRWLIGGLFALPLFLVPTLVVIGLGIRFAIRRARTRAVR